MKEVKEFDESKTGVKGLSDSGITNIPRIFIHAPEKISGENSVGIPVIDLSDVQSPDKRPAIVEQIREAASIWGFFQVINHSIPLSVLDEIITAIKRFHEHPQELKAESEAATWHDYVSVWLSPPDMAPPADRIPTVYRRELAVWDKHAAEMGSVVAELLSEGLGLDSKRLKQLSLLETRIFGGMYYPYCPQPDLTVGLSDHTDPGVLTILLPNQVWGLQVMHEGKWVDVKPLPGALLFNIGDFLQIVSNGKYKSVQHRVLANPKKEARISIVHWFDVGNWGDSDEHGPLPELILPEKPAQYRRFTKQEYLENFYSKGLDSKSLVAKLKL
ncbi:Iron/ascorbate family oxidoreductase [Handroanthus impetiginosus]|uniref:Iron/ascorbate family oxidoreductase n=1 Tax=Handroanthus impetiginosus TaxID=429701 RepID=A0A2G9HIJ9_9LAMI|nr:Iron/ascorbate family oxidoreductase [Handroanthus impetiginosus]